MTILNILKYARERDISDIHIIENEKVYFREFGEIKENKDFLKITGENIREICENKIEKDFIYIDEFGIVDGF